MSKDITNNDFQAAFKDFIRSEVLAILNERENGTTQIHNSSQDDDTGQLRAQIERIKSKEFVTVSEASLLLSCSESHLRNLVGKARKGKSKRPVPFYDLDGITVFSPEELLDWAKTPKINLKLAR